MGEKQAFRSVSLVHNPGMEAYCLEVPFDPPEIYPELSAVNKTNSSNSVYETVRGILTQLDLDQDHFGTSDWNPFRSIVQPGNTVLIKPNLVSPRHLWGEEALWTSIIHGSVLRPIIDYVHLALQGRGAIIITDNPVAGADFDEIMKFTGIKAMVQHLRTRGYDNLQVIDLRPRLLREGANGDFYYETVTGDPLGYVTVDLGRDSLFSEFDQNPDLHYYTLSDQAIDHLDPKCVRASTTDKFHHSGAHQYLVSKSILNADVIINVAKMKTHCKAGVSLTLKNMIGMVYLKECMPHHRPGPPPEGDSFPQYPASYYVFLRKTYRNFRKWFGIHKIPGFRNLRDSMQKHEIILGQHIEHGNWKGNDTIWRTILDLNRIALYADQDGRMQDEPQRRIFSLIDGIIAQEGEGPMAGRPKTCSMLIGGLNSVLVDALAVKAMGVDYRMIPTLARAKDMKKWKLLTENNIDLSMPDIQTPNLDFQLPKGWR